MRSILLAGVFLAGAVFLPAPASGPVLPPCAQEDSGSAYACYWDASSRGNGLGRSFVSWPAAQGDAVVAYAG